MVPVRKFFLDRRHCLHWTEISVPSLRRQRPRGSHPPLLPEGQGPGESGAGADHDAEDHAVVDWKPPWRQEWADRRPGPRQAAAVAAAAQGQASPEEDVIRTKRCLDWNERSPAHHPHEW